MWRRWGRPWADPTIPSADALAVRGMARHRSARPPVGRRRGLGVARRALGALALARVRTAAQLGRAPADDRSDPFRTATSRGPMQKLRNLPLAARLGVAFGALALGLLFVSFVSFRATDTLNERVEELSVEVPEYTSIVQGMAARLPEEAHLTVRHLYVFDGELENQDKVAAEFEKLAKADEAALATMGEVLAEVDERVKSRAAYTEQLAPLHDELSVIVAENSAATVAYAGAEGDEASEAIAATKWSILIVGVISLLIALVLAVFTTRSVVRPVRAVRSRLQTLHDHCLSELAAGLEAAADGDLTREVVSSTKPIQVRSDDELGRLSATFNAMLGNAQRS